MNLQDTNLFNTDTASDGVSAQSRSLEQKREKRTPSQISSNLSSVEIAFQQLVDAIAHQLAPHKNTHFTVSLAGEDTEFVRFNRSQVRQTGHVHDGQITVTLIAGDEEDAPSSIKQTSRLTLPFTGEFTADWAIAQPALSELRAELTHLPSDPYAVIPTSCASQSSVSKIADGISNQAATQSREVHTGNLLSTDRVADTLLKPVQTMDFSGLYAGGSAYRAYADSAGKRHWFETPAFTLDYSLFGSRKNQAVKGTLAGRTWNESEFLDNIAATAQQLARLAKPVKTIPRGSYRTYLAPAAVADLINTIAWGGGLGEAALRQGNSAFSKLERGEARLSEKFSLQENFERIAIPKFNNTGEIAPAQLPVIQAGRWVGSLVNGRSAKEYGKASNGANAEEAMRASTVAPGALDEADILAELGTGLYLSNLHYLNWSDLSAGRITGMTRYACFWVENGEIVAPIENLRFDDDLYRFLGECLIDLTRQQTFLPAVGTYDRRSLGGMWMPGMLIDQFRYTL